MDFEKFRFKSDFVGQNKVTLDNFQKYSHLQDKYVFSFEVTRLDTTLGTRQELDVSFIVNLRLYEKVGNISHPVNLQDTVEASIYNVLQLAWKDVECFSRFRSILGVYDVIMFELRGDKISAYHIANR